MIDLEKLLIVIQIAAVVGLLYSFFTVALMLSFRVLNYPDLTIEGSLVLGGALTYKFLSYGINPFYAIFISGLIGSLAGFFTGFLHVKLKVNKLLSGIISAAMLYSISIRLMSEKSNVKLSEFETIFKLLNPNGSINVEILILSFFALLLLIILHFVFKSKPGYYIRVVGDNPKFLSSLSKNPKVYIVLGLMLSNFIIAVGGSILAQYKDSVDINYSFGILVSSLAAILIGDVFFLSKSVQANVISNILGTICYSLIIGIIMESWSDDVKSFLIASDVKFFTGLLLILPILILKFRRNHNHYKFFKSDW